MTATHSWGLALLAATVFVANPLTAAADQPLAPTANKCPKVKEHLNNSSGGGPGEWTKSNAVCKGQPHVYKVNVGCSGPGKPRCGTCTVKGELSGAAKASVAVHDENGKKRLASGPKTASAPVKYGGTFSVRVQTGAPRASYKLKVTYSCK